jgi:hypothetical protein
MSPVGCGRLIYRVSAMIRHRGQTGRHRQPATHKQQAATEGSGPLHGWAVRVKRSGHPCPGRPRSSAAMPPLSPPRGWPVGIGRQRRVWRARLTPPARRGAEREGGGKVRCRGWCGRSEASHGPKAAPCRERGRASFFLGTQKDCAADGARHRAGLPALSRVRDGNPNGRKRHGRFRRDQRYSPARRGRPRNLPNRKASGR